MATGNYAADEDLMSTTLGEGVQESEELQDTLSSNEITIESITNPVKMETEDYAVGEDFISTTPGQGVQDSEEVQNTVSSNESSNESVTNQGKIAMKDYGAADDSIPIQHDQEVEEHRDSVSSKEGSIESVAHPAGEGLISMTPRQGVQESISNPGKIAMKDYGVADDTIPIQDDQEIEEHWDSVSSKEGSIESVTHPASEGSISTAVQESINNPGKKGKGYYSDLISTTLGKGVQEEYEKLQHVVNETKEVLTGLESRQSLELEKDETARMLLEKINELYYGADDVVDEFSFEALRMKMEIEKSITRKISYAFSLSNPLLFRFRMSRKIKAFCHALDKLKGQMKLSDSGLAENRERNEIGGQWEKDADKTKMANMLIDSTNEEIPLVIPIVGMGIDENEINEIGLLPTANIDDTSEAYGRAVEKSEIIKLVRPMYQEKEKCVSVIPIVATAGVGKTTIARLIFNDDSIRSHFDQRLWVSVSKEFEEEEILKQIIRDSTKSMPDVTTLDNLWRKVKEILSGQRFCLVLDDVWKNDEKIWENFKTSLGVCSKGSIILVTTRSHEVGLSMVGSSNRPFILGGLSEEGSWGLFKTLAFGRGGAEESEDLFSIGRELVPECRGIPEAIKALGAFMHSRTSIHEWKAVLDSKRLGTPLYADAIIPALRLAYNHLEYPLKRCFAYCSLFPKHCIIDKEKLIQLWMAEGFLNTSASAANEEEQDIGDEYLRLLVFLEVRWNGSLEEIRCRMPDLVHDLAPAVLRNEFMMVKNVDEEQQLISERKPRHLSLSVRGTQSIPDQLYVKMKKLRTCLGCRPSNISTGLLLSNLKSLRVLQLTHLREEVPSSIGELIHLRYLDLSDGGFTALPASITRLFHLQTLKLLRCKNLRILPKGMKELNYLRHLDAEPSLKYLRGVYQELQDTVSSNIESESVNYSEKMATGDYAGLISTTLGQSVQEEYEKLQHIVSETKGMLTVLERRHLVSAEKDAIARIKELYYGADDVLDEFSFTAMRMKLEIEKHNTRKVSNTFSVSHPLLFRLKMSRKIKAFCHEFNKLKAEVKLPDSEVLVENSERNEMLSVIPTVGMGGDENEINDAANIEDTSQVCGREEEKAELVEWIIDTINDKECFLSFIPMVATAGIGKTTLASLIFNDESIRSHFDLRFWVSLSKEFEVEKILRQIIRVSSRSIPDVTTVDNLWDTVQEIVGGKRFLLILDDLRSLDDEKTWVDFEDSLNFGPGASQGSTVLVTTRSHWLSMESSYHPFILRGLSEEGSWGLFKTLAFGRGGAEESEDLFSIGRELVSECRGIPEAIKALGVFMHSRTSIHEWKAVLDSKRLGTPVYADTIIPALRLTYNHLEYPLKRCFAYCSLYPKHCIIDREELILQWKAEGFLNTSGANKKEEEKEDKDKVKEEEEREEKDKDEDGEEEEEKEDKDKDDEEEERVIGNEYFQLLLVFLEVVKKDEDGEVLECRMPDLVHDFARTVSRNELMAVENVDEVEQLISERELRHLSFYVRGPQSIPDKLFVEMKKVRRFVGCSPSNIPTGLLLSKFKSLRVLQLTHLQEEVASSIGELIHLRYLDLSHGRFKALPESISKLLHLQTLKLLCCRYLQRLPKGMKKLVKLKHLEIEPSLDIPRGLGQLCNLRTLTAFKVGNNDTEAGIEELGCLKQLEGRLSLTCLNNVKNEAAAKAAKFEEKAKLKELTLAWESEWHDDCNHKNVLEALGHPSDLIVLTIMGFSGSSLPRRSIANYVRELCIYSCHNVKSLEFHSVFYLQKLMISHCESLESIDIEKSRALEVLDFRRCDQLEFLRLTNRTNTKFSPDNLVELRIESCDYLATFKWVQMLGKQSLKRLHVQNCANPMVLTEGLRGLSSLQHLHLEACSNLESLPRDIRHLSSLQHLAISDCPKLISTLDEMQDLTSLQTLSIFACPNLRALPLGIAKITSLQELKIERCSNLTVLPNFLDHLSSLKELEILNCSVLTSLPPGMQHLISLQKLKIVGCDMRNLPEELGNCSALRVLTISGCPNFKALPDSLGDLSSLKDLEISSCNSLMSLPEQQMHKLTSLEQLKIDGCGNLEALPNALGNGSALRELAIIDCPKLTYLPVGLGKLQNLRRLEISGCSKLPVLPGTVALLSSLESLYIRRCSDLICFPNFMERLTSLKVLWLTYCPKLECLSDRLEGLTALEKLVIRECDNLVDFLSGGISSLESLQVLSISHCSKLQTLPKGLEKLPSLKRLVICKCPNLRSSASVMKQLREKLDQLKIEDCPDLGTP